MITRVVARQEWYSPISLFSVNMPQGYREMGKTSVIPLGSQQTSGKWSVGLSESQKLWKNCILDLVIDGYRSCAIFSRTKGQKKDSTVKVKNLAKSERSLEDWVLRDLSKCRKNPFWDVQLLHQDVSVAFYTDLKKIEYNFKYHALHMHNLWSQGRNSTKMPEVY